MNWKCLRKRTTVWYFNKKKEKEDMAEQIKKMTTEMQFLKNSNEGLKREITDVTRQQQKDKSNMGKNEETTNYVVKRTKNISKKVDDFYSSLYGQTHVNYYSSDNSLNFDKLGSQLDRIFNDLKANRPKTQKHTFPLSTADTDVNRLSLSSDKKSSTNRLSPTPKYTQKYRSKSPLNRQVIFQDYKQNPKAYPSYNTVHHNPVISTDNRYMFNKNLPSK